MAKRNAGNEQLVLTQSIVMFAFGLACWTAADSINKAWDAINDTDSMVAIATDGALVTDKTQVDLTTTKAIVTNFEYICVTVITISVLLSVVTLLRLLRK